MQTTPAESTLERAQERYREERRRVDELATLASHLSAATARWLELAWELREQVSSDDFAGWLGYRCGVTGREAREYMRVAEALQDLPAIRAAFSRGEMTYTKVRALTRVATGANEERLLELAGALTASQLERALRVFRRITAEDARETHELEYVELPLRGGRLALPARPARRRGRHGAREGAGRRAGADRGAAAEEERNASSAKARRGRGDVAAAARAPPVAAWRRWSSLPRRRSPRRRTSGTSGAHELVVHVDAATLTADARGRSELEDGPVVAPRPRGGWAATRSVVAQVERDGLPLSAGRKRRTVPPTLRRLLGARDGRPAASPAVSGAATYRRTIAALGHGGETSLDNLVLLCFHHHRFVHEGGYTVEDDGAGGLRFRNRYGVLTPSSPPRPPPGDADDLLAEQRPARARDRPEDEPERRLRASSTSGPRCRRSRRGRDRVASGSPDPRFPCG